MAKIIADLDFECENISVTDEHMEMENIEAKSCRDKFVELSFHLRCNIFLRTKERKSDEIKF